MLRARQDPYSAEEADGAAKPFRLLFSDSVTSLFIASVALDAEHSIYQVGTVELSPEHLPDALGHPFTRFETDENFWTLACSIRALPQVRSVVERRPYSSWRTCTRPGERGFVDELPSSLIEAEAARTISFVTPPS